MAQPFWGGNLTGLDDFGAVVESKMSGPEWLVGSEVGIEDSILSFLTLGLIFGAFYLYARRNHLLRRGDL